MTGEFSAVTGEFPAQSASNAENVSIWWRHHEDFTTWQGTSLLALTMAARRHTPFHQSGPRRKRIPDVKASFQLYFPGKWRYEKSMLSSWLSWDAETSLAETLTLTPKGRENIPYSNIQWQRRKHVPGWDANTSYRQVSNIRHTNSQHLKDSRTVLQLSLPNTSKPEWRCSWSSAHRWCSNYIWVINNYIAY